MRNEEYETFFIFSSLYHDLENTYIHMYVKAQYLQETFIELCSIKEERQRRFIFDSNNRACHH